MIRFEGVEVRYDGADTPVLAGVDLTVSEGEFCLVVGETGTGKSTLLGCVNGLVPHFTGGRLTGRVCVGDRDTRRHKPRELADLVGYVGQDPLSGFVTDTVEDELAYGMESLGVAPPVMRRRVEEALDLLGIAEIRSRPLLSISAGQQQRVAIAAALTMQPRVLVLDEPTSALDPSAAEEVLAALTRLVDDLGTTLLVAEHRLERVAQYPDRVVWLPARAVPPRVGPAQQVLADATIAPPVVALARLAGWSPPPLSVRDARRVAGPLRSSLAAAVPARANSRAGAPIAAVRRLAAGYAEAPVLREVSLELHAGEVTAVMGRNGAGKSTLLRCLVGLHRPDRGEVRVTGRVGLVPQQPTDLLYSETVARECRAADRDAGAAPGTTQALLDLLAPGLPATAHPRDLSEGQRLCLALAVVLAAAPRLLLLDEPTRGLDYPAKTRLVTVLRRVAGDGHAVVLVTHDVELAAEAADRVVVLAGGETVTDGPAAEVLTASAAFAPQVAKVLSPVALLTTSDVRLALAAAGKR